MRVAFNAVAAKSGGAITYLMNLFSELNANETEYILLVPPGTASKLNLHRSHIRIIETSIGFGTGWRRFLWDQAVLRWYLIKNEINLLVSTSDFGMLHSPCPQILLVRNALFFSSQYRRHVLRKKPWRARLDYHLRRFLVRLSIGSADRISVASKAMLDMIAADVKGTEAKAVVNPFGVSRRQFRRPRGAEASAGTQPGDEMRLLYVSEYADYKNLGTLLKAVRTLNEVWTGKIRLTVTVDPSTFLLSDSVTAEVDRRLALDPGVIKAVEFIGAVPYDRIGELYACSDVFVFPSFVESFGHPLVEAMASGLPIIASDNPVHREVCGEAALYFAPESVVDLTEQIKRLQCDSALRRRLTERGTERVLMLQSWGDHVIRFESLMREVALRGHA